MRHLEESEMQTKEKKVKIPQHGTISKGFLQEETPTGTKPNSLQARDPKAPAIFRGQPKATFIPGVSAT